MRWFPSCACTAGCATGAECRLCAGQGFRSYDIITNEMASAPTARQGGTSAGAVLAFPLSGSPSVGSSRDDGTLRAHGWRGKFKCEAPYADRSHPFGKNLSLARHWLHVFQCSNSRAAQCLPAWAHRLCIRWREKCQLVCVSPRVYTHLCLLLCSATCCFAVKGEGEVFARAQPRRPGVQRCDR